MGRVIPGLDFAWLSLLGDFFSATPMDVTLLDGRVIPNVEKWKATVPLLNGAASLWTGAVKTGTTILSQPITDFKVVVVELSLDASTVATMAATRRTAVILVSSLNDGLEQPLITLV